MCKKHKLIWTERFGYRCYMCGKGLGKIEPGGIIETNLMGETFEIVATKEQYERIHKPTKRLERDDYFMEIARTVARRSTCPRAQVGAVVISHRNRILGTGYNGSPPRHPHCLEVGCRIIVVEGKTYCIRTIHAEVNAVLTVQDQSDKLILYTTHFPCFECIKVIAAKGITEVKYLAEYTDPKWELIKDEYSQITFTHI